MTFIYFSIVTATALNIITVTIMISIVKEVLCLLICSGHFNNFTLTGKSREELLLSLVVALVLVSKKQ
jgi:hypothetical protein